MVVLIVYTSVTIDKKLTMEKKLIDRNHKIGRPVGLRTWIEIDSAAVEHNFSVIKKLVSSTVKIMAVVKSNAYGHSLYDFSKCMADLGADWLGVDSITEALALRKKGISTPILVMGYTLPELLIDALENDISVTVSNIESLKYLEQAMFTKPLKIHIEVDTGLHRQGFLSNEISEVVKTVSRLGLQVKLEGLYTHLADAKRPEGEEYTRLQFSSFEKAKNDFFDAGHVPFTHVCASASTLRYLEENTYDMVRIGALLYGIWPSKEVGIEFKGRLTIKPTLSWKTIITEIKKLPKGSPVGYNRTEILLRDSVVAVCPVGYWHGYPGSLSSKGIVVVRGKNAKVLGRVTMDMITIDITDCGDVSLLDIVTLTHETQNLDAGVSEHELLTRLNPKIERIYV